MMDPASVSYTHLQRATQRVLTDLVRYYFPLYELPPEDMLAYSPLLGFVEALIYQADEQVEQAIAAGLDPTIHWTPQRNAIQALLTELDLLTPKVQQDLDGISLLFQLEHQLLGAISNEQTPTAIGPDLNEDSPQGTVLNHRDLIRVTEVRSSDYRVLHGLLIQLANIPYEPAIFGLLWTYEVLVEIMEDVRQYEEDIAANTYNTYRLLASRYGLAAPKQLQILLVHYRQQFADRLQRFSAPQQQRYLNILEMDPQSLEFLDYPSDIPPPILETARITPASF